MSEGANFHASAAGYPYKDTNPEGKAVLLHRISDLEKELQAVHQQLLDEKARAVGEARRLLESIAELEARINAVELCQGISDYSTAKSESQIRKKAKKMKKRNRGKSRQNSICNTNPSRDTTARQESTSHVTVLHHDLEQSQDQESSQKDQESKSCPRAKLQPHKFRSTIQVPHSSLCLGCAPFNYPRCCLCCYIKSGGPP